MNLYLRIKFKEAVMGKDDRKKMMGYVLEDWLWRIETGIPLENARFLTFRDYELTTPEKVLEVR